MNAWDETTGGGRDAGERGGAAAETEAGRAEADAGPETDAGPAAAAGPPKIEPLRARTPALNSEDARQTYKVLEASLRDLWAVVDNLAAVLPPRPRYYRVTIFGSSRMHPGDFLYAETKRLASELAAMGCDIVTGGGPGVMQAANEGEREGDVLNRTYSIGLNVTLPHEQESNPYVEKLYHHGTFFSRLHHFVQVSSAFVVMPGGIGTMLEAALVWQLCQVGHLYDRPLVFVGEQWRGLVEWGREYWLSAERCLADAKDLEIPICVDTVDEAVDIVRRSLEKWAEDAT
ncbi:MAG: LOG family protein [Gemmatimonadota bacterium]|nr:LOG family protein [Gemmatimonadota bacterium]